MGLVVHNLGVCSYSAALATQEELVARKIKGQAADHLLLLEHPPVYTLGRGADIGDLRGADERLGVPVFRVSRGGGVTFHGPGQLVAYPIVTLQRGGRDVHRYVRQLEDVVIAVCADFNITARRRPGQTGVWVGDAKIASIGVGVRRWTTFHGVALNVAPDLDFFRHIVPCRMPDLAMTSIALELDAVPPMTNVVAAFERQFRVVFGYVEQDAAQECHP